MHKTSHFFKKRPGKVCDLAWVSTTQRPSLSNWLKASFLQNLSRFYSRCRYVLGRECSVAQGLEKPAISSPAICAVNGPQVCHGSLKYSSQKWPKNSFRVCRSISTALPAEEEEQKICSCNFPRNRAAEHRRVSQK